jgi:hypothetical protein
LRRRWATGRGRERRAATSGSATRHWCGRQYDKAIELFEQCRAIAEPQRRRTTRRGTSVYKVEDLRAEVAEERRRQARKARQKETKQEERNGQDKHEEEEVRIQEQEEDVWNGALIDWEKNILYLLEFKRKEGKRTHFEKKLIVQYRNSAGEPINANQIN